MIHSQLTYGKLCRAAYCLPVMACVMLVGMDELWQDVVRQEEERPFRLMFALMYVGLIAAVVYFNMVSQCGENMPFGGMGALVVALLALLGIERYEHQHLEPHLPQQAAVVLLLARVFLVEAVVYLDCAHFAPLLYPVISFSVYFSFRPAVSNGLSLAYFVLYLGRLWRDDPTWYDSQVALTIFLVFMLLLVFMQMMARVIDHDERRRRHTERLLADLEASHVKLQAYAAQVAELAATEERNRLARDIHDSLGHYLTAVNVQLEKAQAFWARDPAEAQVAMGEARQSAREALQDVRRSVAALRDADDHFSLRTALADLARGMDNGRLHITLNVSGEETGYTRPVLMTLYRAAQEGLTNIQKHAQATAVTLTLILGEQEAKLCLWDNGHGFDPATLGELRAAPQHSFGLQGIRERVELARGQMTLTSTPQQGTELCITAPKNPMWVGAVSSASSDARHPPGVTYE